MRVEFMLKIVHGDHTYYMFEYNYTKWLEGSDTVKMYVSELVVSNHMGVIVKNHLGM